MYSSSPPRPDATGRYAVRDAPRLIGMLLLMALIALGSAGGVLYGFLGAWASAGPDQRRTMVVNWSVLAAVALLVEGVLFLRFRANAAGIVIDFTRRTISFPGGNVAPNGVLDYFRPSFLLQSFHRYTIDVADIRQINVRRMRPSGGHAEGSRSPYAIWFNGSFGAASVTFTDRGKCEEICSAIRQVNGMGAPIIRG